MINLAHTCCSPSNGDILSTCESQQSLGSTGNQPCCWARASSWWSCAQQWLWSCRAALGKQPLPIRLGSLTAAGPAAKCISGIPQAQRRGEGPWAVARILAVLRPYRASLVGNGRHFPNVQKQIFSQEFELRTEVQAQAEEQGTVIEPHNYWKIPFHALV